MLIERNLIVETCKEIRQSGKKIVFTNGCFDILHVGHVRYLTTAKSFGDILIVGLNTDESVKILKGESRPINNEKDRAEVLLGLKAVDYVVMFGERTAENLVSEIRPDVYVKGADYTVDKIPEAKIVQSYGGRVELVQFVAGHSTTNIIRQIAKTP
jgi:rfaE bifunctional protein nucleotidyltransferase chain/domain